MQQGSPTLVAVPSSAAFASSHATLLKATKLKKSDEERLHDTGLVLISRVRYTAADVRDGQGVDTAALYDQVQGKLRRRVNPKILLVMRSRAAAGFFAHVLMRHGCEVVVCTNGHKAYTSYLRKNSHEFSLCLCQWYLPGIAGRDLAFYEAESGGRLPFVALLGPNQRASDAIRSGADIFFKLPLLPHLKYILSLVLPHASALAQIKVGTMSSNLDGMRRLWAMQQDIMHHSVETNLLADLVRQDLAAISDISSMEVGISMLDAIASGLKNYDELQRAATMSAATGGASTADFNALSTESSSTTPLRGGKMNAAAAALIKNNRGKGPNGGKGQNQKMAAVAQEIFERGQQMAAVREQHLRSVSQSFRNAMIVYNKVRGAFIEAQQENHRLRETQQRSTEHIQYLKGQLRSMGVDVQEGKLERLYLPKTLTRSPPPEPLLMKEKHSIDSSVADDPPFHEVVASDTSEVDVSQFSKHDLLRALRAARAALLSSDNEIRELNDQLRRLQDYQIEIEDDLMGAGVAVHFHIKGPELAGDSSSEAASPDSVAPSGGGAPDENASFASQSSQSSPLTGKHGDSAANDPVRIAEGAFRALLQNTKATKFGRSLSVLGPRAQEGLIKAATMNSAESGGDDDDRMSTASTASRATSRTTSKGKWQAAVQRSSSSGKMTGNKTSGATTTSVPPSTAGGRQADEPGSPFARALNSTVAGGANNFHVPGGNMSVPEAILQRRRSRQDADTRRFLTQQLYWAAHVNRCLEKQAMAAEDVRSNAVRIKTITPVPKCSAKPIPVEADALDTLANQLIMLHNQIATDVNTATAKLSAMFPTSGAPLQQMSLGVKQALLTFDVGQRVLGVQLFVEGKLMKILTEERSAWAKERAEMEKYKVQNPPNSRKVIFEQKQTIRELRMRRWRDWFQSIDTRVRADYIRKWLLWFVGRRQERKWVDNVKFIENDAKAAAQKRYAEQQAFARRQSTDLLSKTSAQKVEFDQLQNKFQRVSTLYDEAKGNASRLQEEVDALQSRCDDLANRKVLLDEQVRDKSTTIYELTQGLQPLQEQNQALQATVDEKDAKLGTLQAQVSILQKKVQQMLNKGISAGGGGPGSANVVGSTKFTQTAISNSKFKEELDGILYLRSSSRYAGSLRGSMQIDTSGEFSNFSIVTSAETDGSSQTSGGGGQRAAAHVARQTSDDPLHLAFAGETVEEYEDLSGDGVLSDIAQENSLSQEQLQEDAAGGAALARAMAPAMAASKIAGSRRRKGSLTRSPQSIALANVQPDRGNGERWSPETQTPQIGRSPAPPPPLSTFRSPTSVAAIEVETPSVRELSTTSQGTKNARRRASAVVSTNNTSNNSPLTGATKSQGSSRRGSSFVGPTRSILSGDSSAGTSSGASRKRAVSISGKPAEIPTSARSNATNRDEVASQASVLTEELHAPWMLDDPPVNTGGMNTTQGFPAAQQNDGTVVETVDRGCHPRTPLVSFDAETQAEGPAPVHTASKSTSPPPEPPVAHMQTQTNFVPKSQLNQPVQSVRSTQTTPPPPTTSSTQGAIVEHLTLEANSVTASDLPMLHQPYAGLLPLSQMVSESTEEHAAYTSTMMEVPTGFVSTGPRPVATSITQASQLPLDEGGLLCVVPNDDSSPPSQQNPSLEGSRRRTSSLSPMPAGQTAPSRTEYSDISSWQSAVKELRKRASVGATSPMPLPTAGYSASAAGASAAAVSAPAAATTAYVSDIVDSTRRLFEILAIPQTVLIKSTDPHEMLEKLRSVMEAATLMMSRKRQTQQQATAGNAAPTRTDAPTTGGGSSMGLGGAVAAPKRTPTNVLSPSNTSSSLPTPSHLQHGLASPTSVGMGQMVSGSPLSGSSPPANIPPPSPPQSSTATRFPRLSLNVSDVNQQPSSQLPINNTGALNGSVKLPLTMAQQASPVVSQPTEGSMIPLPPQPQQQQQPVGSKIPSLPPIAVSSPRNSNNNSVRSLPGQKEDDVAPQSPQKWHAKVARPVPENLHIVTRTSGANHSAVKESSKAPSPTRVAPANSETTSSKISQSKRIPSSSVDAPSRRVHVDVGSGSSQPPEAPREMRYPNGMPVNNSGSSMDPSAEVPSAPTAQVTSQIRSGREYLSAQKVDMGSVPRSRDLDPKVQRVNIAAKLMQQMIQPKPSPR